MTDSLPPEGKHPDVIDAEAWLDQLTSLNPSSLINQHAEVLRQELGLLRDRVANREAMNDTLRRDLMEAISHHQADIARISDKARAAAEHRRVSRADVEALHAARLAADPMVPFALVASELARHLKSHLSGSASMEDEAEAREVLAAFYALRASMVRQAAS